MASPLPSPGTPNMNRADSQIAFHQIYWAFNFVDCRKMRFATVFIIVWNGHTETNPNWMKMNWCSLLWGGQNRKSNDKQPEKAVPLSSFGEKHDHHQRCDAIASFYLNLFRFGSVRSYFVISLSVGTFFGKNDKTNKLTSHCGSESSVRFTPHPSNGGIHISADIIQTAAIITNARAGVRVFRYSTAFVILQYRSNDIKHKFIIEAVDKSTSMAAYMERRVRQREREREWKRIFISELLQ